MSPGSIAVIALSAFLFLWYLAGHLYNRRQGRRLRDWAERGLEQWGESLQGGWLGSPASGARILVHQARPPFRRMEVTLLLENREIPILWLADRLQGKRDALILKATCRTPEKGALHVGPPSQVLVPPLLSWHQEKGPHGLVMAFREPGKPRRMAVLQPWLERYGPHLRHLILQEEDPHLTLWVNVTDLARTTTAAAFFQDLERLCHTA